MIVGHLNIQLQKNKNKALSNDYKELLLCNKLLHTPL